MCRLDAIVVALLLARSAGAQEETKARPETPEQSAERVVAAWKVTDDAALETLAKRDAPDPWLVVDVLCHRGLHESASVFARTAPRPDTRALPAYVATMRGRTPDHRARVALAAAIEALGAGNPDAVLAGVRTAPAEPSGVVSVRLLQARALALHSQGRLDLAAAAFRDAAEAAERIGWLVRATASWNMRAALCSRLSQLSEAREAWARSLHCEETRGDRAGMALCLTRVGLTHFQLGAYAEALGCEQRAARLWEELGKPVDLAWTVWNVGLVHFYLGDYARALPCYTRALKLFESAGFRAGMATALGSIGNVHLYAREYQKALVSQARALELNRELGNRAGTARDLGNLGVIYQSLGDYPKALAHHERALAIHRELRDRTREAISLLNIGWVHGRTGALDEAVAFGERAIALASETGALEFEVQSLGKTAGFHLAGGRAAVAAELARRGVEKLPLLVRGLAEEQGALARDRWTGMLATGIRAGVLLEDVTEVAFFMESGRAGTLLESLGGREALRGAGIPDDLRRDEAAAQAAVVAARIRHARAGAGNSVKAIRASRAALEEAQQKMLDAASRIQRAAKAAAEVSYPRAAPLEKIRAALGAQEALALYELSSNDALALVVTRKEARLARLGKTKAIEAALQALSLQDPTRDPSAAVTTLRGLVFTRLGLDASVKRLLVSPAAALSYVPVSVLAQEHEVVYVPSGTTYAVLRDEPATRGRDVLALGDPDYVAERDAQASAVFRSADRGTLAPLPGTREEARAVGDVVLLGKAATETRLGSALATHGAGWRAVHLACHGLVDPENPRLSSLALTAETGNDGFLTVLEVFRMKIPADLVVLSACETAKGKVYRAEGIIGFTRAFMMAGAPRVIVSLWKVDDQATRTLMVKFYELWNPKDGSKGLPTATALKRAQEFVASHEKWKHPYYWAAWQLWGLGD